MDRMAEIAVLVVASDWARMTLSMYFFWIAFLGICVLGISALLGHGDHDVDHDIDHDHDMGHDHDSDHGGSGNLSFFSFRILMMFTVGFGCAGYFGARSGLDALGSSLVGIGGGFVFGFLTWLVMNYLYKHQGTSTVNTARLVGTEGVVITTVAPDGAGEIVCSVGGSQVWLSARTQNAMKLPVNTRVRIAASLGSAVLVEPVTESTPTSTT